ncbi:sensor protein VraS [Striga asiatica]|uniref:Sensor protein VraS n=1 Tax=Striga asiatica TaxID=4170 RepID=A0A5A7PGS0_STRAF|nr:sensor protein VraS [Striga asiatica]
MRKRDYDKLNIQIHQMYDNMSNNKFKIQDIKTATMLNQDTKRIKSEVHEGFSQNWALAEHYFDNPEPIWDMLRRTFVDVSLEPYPREDFWKMHLDFRPLSSWQPSIGPKRPERQR